MKGITKLAAQHGLSYQIVYRRLQRGIPLELALKMPRTTPQQAARLNKSSPWRRLPSCPPKKEAK